MTTKLEELANKFKPSWKKPNRDELNEFVKESLLLISQVNELYKKFFVQKTNPDWTVANSLLVTIENRVNKLWELYKQYFVNTQEETGNTIVTDIENFTKKIKDYHTELLEWTTSIKADIEQSQTEINEFYYYLFDKIVLWEWEEKTEDGFVIWDIRSEKLKQYIVDIKEFYDKLEWDSEQQWYQAAIESFHNYLYQKQEGKTESTADKVKKDIETIQIFRDTKYDTIIWEIEQAKKDANSLLNAATGGSLVEWYEQSKNEYKLTGKTLEWIKKDGENDNIIWIIWRNIIKVTIYYFGQLFDYLLFILPLAWSVVIFVNPELLKHIGIENADTSKISFLSRFLISIPLWWISLFGQRSLSQRKRIAEEYNHKVQVLKTYLNFTTNQSEYPIDKVTKQALDKEVLEVIKRRPWDIYGKDESMFDKIIELIRSINWSKVEELPKNNDSN